MFGLGDRHLGAVVQRPVHLLKHAQILLTVGTPFPRQADVGQRIVDVERPRLVLVLDKDPFKKGQLPRAWASYPVQNLGANDTVFVVPSADAHQDERRAREEPIAWRRAFSYDAFPGVRAI